VVSTSPLPANVRTWSVHDVSRWLESLSLPQYKDAFLEGSVDGPFLLELREEDLVQVLNIKHKLHVRKILISREKLKPLSQQELREKEAVEREDRADATRQDMGVPSLDTVFSQARNGRIKRVEESLNLGMYTHSDLFRVNHLWFLYSMLIKAFQSTQRMRKVTPYYWWLLKTATSAWRRCCFYVVHLLTIRTPRATLLYTMLLPLIRRVHSENILSNMVLMILWRILLDLLLMMVLLVRDKLCVKFYLYILV
jgi:hypothetical protein